MVEETLYQTAMTIQCKLRFSPLSFLVFDSLCSPAKHILGNDPSTLVVDSLKGLCELNRQVALDLANRGAIGISARYRPPNEISRVSKVVYLASPDPSKVALICGGGSGHEPAHAGFVGDGILAGT